MKILIALLMLGITGFLSYLFGLTGFIVGIGMSIVLSMMFSRSEREKLEEERHKELLEVAKNKSN